MNYKISAYTDIGLRKKTNQDSVLILEADTEIGPVLLAVLCDGMGGLSKGEVASAALVKAFSDWFKVELPALIDVGLDQQNVFSGFGNLAFEMNNRISSYGMKVGVSLGTTVVSLLVADNKYYIMNIGDSRAYKISDNIYQLTKDQTFVQREIDMGRMTERDALISPQRSVLLQCVGASDVIKPDFYYGEVMTNDVFMLCCDGFRHVITPQEFYQHLNASVLHDEEQMRQVLKDLTELNKNRNEKDNISAILVKIEP